MTTHRKALSSLYVLPEAQIHAFKLTMYAYRCRFFTGKQIGGGIKQPTS